MREREYAKVAEGRGEGNKMPDIITNLSGLTVYKENLIINSLSFLAHPCTANVLLFQLFFYYSLCAGAFRCG